MPVSIWIRGSAESRT